jgi:hypothetical protein
MKYQCLRDFPASDRRPAFLASRILDFCLELRIDKAIATDISCSTMSLQMTDEVIDTLIRSDYELARCLLFVTAHNLERAESALDAFRDDVVTDAVTERDKAREQLLAIGRKAFWAAGSRKR